MQTEMIELDELQRELVVGEAQTIAATVAAAPLRQRFAALAEAATTGSVPVDQANDLAELLALGVNSGRVRSRYGLAADRAARRLFDRTPAGRHRADQADEVSKQLAAVVRGRCLSDISLTVDGPNGNALELKFAGFAMRIEFGPAGATVRRVEIGVGGND